MAVPEAVLRHYICVAGHGIPQRLSMTAKAGPGARPRLCLNIFSLDATEISKIVVLGVATLHRLLKIIGGDDDGGDGGRGGLNWGTYKCLAVCVHAPLFLPNNFKSPLNLQKYLFSNTEPAPVCGYFVRLSAIGL